MLQDQLEYYQDLLPRAWKAPYEHYVKRNIKIIIKELEQRIAEQEAN